MIYDNPFNPRDPVIGHRWHTTGMKTASDRSLQRLQCGNMLLEVCPQLGGSIVGWTIQQDGITTNLLRPVASEQRSAISADFIAETADVLDTGNFPLVPYSGRITNAEFDFLGQRIQQPTLSQFHPHAIHGHGWLSEWQLVGETPEKLIVQYRNEADSDRNQWPWTYTAQQSFTLTEGRLIIDLEIRNESTTSMPAGLGLHPYFPIHDGAIIETSTTGMWLTDDFVLPTEHISIDPQHVCNQPFSPTDQPLDNVFTGWNGHARLTWPGQQFALDLSADTDYLIIFTPVGEDYFCVEPATHAADSFNDNRRSQNEFDSTPKRTAMNPQIIEAGDRLSLSLSLSVDDLHEPRT